MLINPRWQAEYSVLTKNQFRCLKELIEYAFELKIKGEGFEHCETIDDLVKFVKMKIEKKQKRLKKD